MSSSGSPIRVHPENPRYFLYRGRPLVLITATEHYGAVLNRNFDYVRYLAEQADKRVTLTRTFLLYRELPAPPKVPHSPCKPRPAEYVAPWLRTGPGYAVDGYPRFDLDQWDPEYFPRLHGFLAEAARRDIIVELTLFSYNCGGEPVWHLNPLNARNNVNGVGDILWLNYTSMLDEALFERQKAYVRKIVREVNVYDNVYFEVCNEPMADQPGGVSTAEVEAWHAAIREVIREEEAKLPKRHLIFQMPVESRPRGGSHLDMLAAESTVDAINLHNYHRLYYRKTAFHPLGRWTEHDLHLWDVHNLFTACHQVGKPVVSDEDNAATGYLNDEAWTIQRKHAWTTLCSGSHFDMIDRSIQAGGQEAGTPESRAKMRAWIKHLSIFIHEVDFLHATPIRDFCAELPLATIAATLAVPGREYVLYVVDAREVDHQGAGHPCAGRIVFPLPAGSYEARLYSPVAGEYFGPVTRLGGGEGSLVLEPFTHDVVVHVRVMA
ncbi:MAG: cellulase family glycosylhydrolase [Chloroflexi bacterium]|nr:cellulase family glycosylhydrolase [Chloroflexota bacterium]